MKVVVVSKALVVAAYRQKLTELGRLGIDVTAVVPPYWREGGATQRLEGGNDERFDLVVSRIRFNGHFHAHYYPRLVRLLSVLRPDVLHIDEEPYNLATFLATRTARRMGIPSLFFTWQNINRAYPLPFRAMERLVYHWTAHGLAGSREAEVVLRQKGFTRPVTVVPQFGVDPHLFHPGPRHGGPFTVGFLNRLIPAKGPFVALAAVASLDDAHMTIVGDGPLRGEMRSFIRDRGLEARVSMRGRVPSTEIPPLLRGLDVVVLPSLTTAAWKEQFGRVLIEAMACGIPVVGSTSGEIPHVIGDAGILVPEGDERALAEALRRLQTDRVLWEDLSVRGRERVLQRFTHARVAEITRGAYLEALGRREPG